MATARSTIFGGLDIRPNYISPSPGQLEEARMRKLLDQARIDEIYRSGLAQDRQLRLQEREASTREQLGFANLSLEQQKAQVAQFLAQHGIEHDEKTLAEAGRHNLATEGLAKDQTATNFKEHILSLLPQLNPQNQKVAAEYLAAVGAPELKGVIDSTEVKPKGVFGPENTTATGSVNENTSAAGRLGANLRNKGAYFLNAPLGLNLDLARTLPPYLESIYNNPKPLMDTLSNFYSGLTSGKAPTNARAVPLVAKPTATPSPQTELERLRQLSATFDSLYGPGSYPQNPIQKSRSKRYSSEFPGY